MTRLAEILLLVSACNCAAPERLKVKMADDIQLDHTQMLVCGYVLEAKTLVCMSPDEYRFRLGILDDDEPDIQRDAGL